MARKRGCIRGGSRVYSLVPGNIGGLFGGLRFIGKRWSGLGRTNLRRGRSVAEES